MNTTDPYENVKYTNPYLDHVILRLDFLSPVEKYRDTIPTALTKKIVGTFAIPEPKQREVSPADDITSWVFRAKGSMNKVVVSTHHLLLVYHDYQDFELVKAQSIPILNALFEVVPDLLGRRFGLRYINTQRKSTYWT
jgi:uncharacterized protein (TIGR04255 family)